MNKALTSSKNDQWETPQWLFDLLSDRVGGFTIDAAARASNAKCERYYTDDESDRNSMGDALVGQWEFRSRVFVNPPYGGGMRKWAKKIVDESSWCSSITCVVPARVDTLWWRALTHWSHRSRTLIEYIDGRVTFEIDGRPIVDACGRTMNAPFPTAIVTIFRGLDS